MLAVTVANHVSQPEKDDPIAQAQAEAQAAQS